MSEGAGMEGAAAPAAESGGESGGEANANPMDAVRAQLSGLAERVQESAEEVSSDDSQEEAEVSSDDTPEAEATPDKHTIKVDGEEIEVTTEELIRRAQKTSAADRYLEQAKAQMKEVEQFAADVRKASQDPLIRAYMEKGRDGLYDVVAEMLEYEQLPAEERQKRDRQRELEAKAKKADEMEAKQREEQETQLSQQYAQRIEAEVDAMIEAAGFQKSEHAVRRAAGLLEAAFMQKDNTVTREKLAKVLREELQADMRGNLGTIEPEQLAELLGDEGVKKWRQWDASRLKAAQPQVQRGDPEAQRQRRAQRKGNAKPKMRTSEFFAKLRGD